jgi:hypothetical protein
MDTHQNGCLVKAPNAIVGEVNEPQNLQITFLKDEAVHLRIFIAGTDCCHPAEKHA